MNVLSLFAGIGGLELGLERAGMNVVGQVEIDPYCRRVLAKHWPGVPRHDDVRTCVEWWQTRPRPRVDVVCGGFPCQPVSEAGHRMAQTDARWLWPAMASVIDHARPSWIIGENVPGLLDRGLADVLRDLRRLGYCAQFGEVGACAMGAPHMRSRVFILAHANGIRCEGRSNPAGSRRGYRSPERSSWWETEPTLARVANGIPRSVDRIRALGNAVVPQVAEHIGRLIMTAERAA